MNRASLKIVGASGQGIISIGEILAKACKRTGYCVFGYREYMSLIKGGHGSYQIDLSDERIRSSEEQVDVLVCLNHHGFEHNLPDLKQGAVLLHDTPDWTFSKADQKLLKERQVRLVELPTEQILSRLQAKPILGNVLFSAFVWAACGGKMDLLKSLVGAKFAKKKDLLTLNMQVIDEGFAYHKEHHADLHVTLPPSAPTWSDDLLLTGSEAMGLGVVHAGVRLYAGYPMTPSSPLLSYIAEIQNETGMVIKQAEDEITAAQMVSGAMFAGTRALTATSGGGFDLMSETISLNGIIENPCVIVLAQRPGPGTGLPTWTAQGDLLLAVHAGHGEYARCVLSVSDSDDAFTLMNEAFGIAEEFQIPVIVLTDKHIAEGIYTQKPYEQNAVLKRGKLVVKPAELRKLKSTDRFDPKAPDGLSKRWLPGSEAATYVAQGDEHSADGSVDETAENARLQMEKRMKKLEALTRSIPIPRLSGTTFEKSDEWLDNDIDLLLVSWGSNRGVIQDVLSSDQLRTKKIAHLHYTYLWPLNVWHLQVAMKAAKKTVLIECNATAQLGQLIRMQSGIDITDRILKYDGRPFFYNELLAHISSHLS